MFQQVATQPQLQPEPGFVAPNAPSFDTEQMQGQMQQILGDNLGEFVVCEFLIGTQMITKKEGILYSVGVSYIVLYEETTNTYVVCDLFSIKFVTFYTPGQRPARTAAVNRTR